MKYSKRSFKTFLKETLKPENYRRMDFEAYCNELEEYAAESGNPFYEVPARDSKDGIPHTFYF